MDDQDAPMTDHAEIEQALTDTVDAIGPQVVEPEPPARCDCPAMNVPHVHEQGGPVALPSASEVVG